jgi:hypothetical protein
MGPRGRPLAALPFFCSAWMESTVTKKKKKKNEEVGGGGAMGLICHLCESHISNII